MVPIVAFIPCWLLLQLAGLTSIAESNKHTRRAQSALEKGRYAEAATHYTKLAGTTGQPDDAVLANLGQAHMHLADYGHATQAYTRLTLSQDRGMRSLAHTQLGVIASRQKNKGEAVVQTKLALREDPANELARKNMLALLKGDPKLEPPKNQQNQQENKPEDQQNKDQNKDQKQSKDGQQKQDQQNQGQEKKGPEGEKRDQKDKQDEQPGTQNGENNKKKADGKTDQGKQKDQKGAQGSGDVKDAEEGNDNQGQKPKEDQNGEIASKEELQKMQMSEAQAKQLLEAMRGSEVQYLQQRRKRRAKENDGKPAW